MPFKGREEPIAKTIRELHGVELARTPRRVQSARLACTWAGPARWLVETNALAPQPDPLEELEQRMAGDAALVRQTDGRALLRMYGPKVREVLRKGVAIDLHPRSFSPGDVALTLVAGIDVHLWQLDDAPTFELLVNRSVVGSFWHWLNAAAAEFGLECAKTTSEK
jgi:sarcosine oxidase subunit gamma